MPTPVRQSLSSAKWTVQAVGDVSMVPASVRGRDIAATVPGCIHTDLMDAGLIPDPAVGDNEERVQWVSLADWRYECEFEAKPGLFEHHEIDLVFECLDTIARIELNGDRIGEAASEFIPHRFSVLGLLRPGRNHLAVTFKSPLRHVREEAARLGPRPVNGDWDPFVFIRKCASNFRWDWGPAVATCGIASQVRLETSRESPTLPDARRIEVDQTADAGGQSFALLIDDRRVFCRGVNWIPEGLWPRDRTPERVRARLQALRDANVNMLRVWGGGRYEPDWFYELCDALGIMVWQDFMFSCGMYPEDEPLRSLIDAEARHQVSRLSRHPSVVLWCGGNECVWGYESWGWRERLKRPDGSESSWGRGYFQHLLPRVVDEVDSTKPYWLNSPWSGRSEQGEQNTTSRHQRGVNEPTTGDRHTWDVWGEGYRTITPRFCSEFGQQSPSCWATLGEAGLLPGDEPSLSPPSAATPASLVPASLLRRQRGPGGLEGSGITPMQRWYDEPMKAWFPPARTFEQWHYLAQLLQARSLAIGIEWMRASWPTCSGALIWQANDAWPGFSWSIIDSAGRKKLAWYAVRRSFQGRLLSIHPVGGGLGLFALNDTDAAWDSVAVARRLAFDGRELARAEVQVQANGRSVKRIADVLDVLGKPREPRAELIRVQIGECVTDSFFAPDKDLEFHSGDFALAIEQDADTLRARITARTLLRHAALIADQLAPAASADDQLFNLLPGESRTFTIVGAGGPSSEAAVRRAIRFVNI
jgi:beta-mannosidase